MSLQFLTLFIALGFGRVQADQPLTFEVASIKPTPADQGTEYGPEPGGRFSARGTTLKQLVALAYGVQEDRILGGPKWMAKDRWSIEAKAAGFKNRFNREQLLQVMKALLADRFQLRTRVETKKMPVYALVVAKSGPKLKPPGEHSSTVRLGRGFVSGTSVSMDLLARALSAVLERPVVNQTGVKGEFEVHLEWLPESEPEEALAHGEPTASPDADASLASIFTAIQSELGLRLKATRGAAEVVEVLGAERPSQD